MLHDAARLVLHALSQLAVHMDIHAGLQHVALASCVCDTALWQELQQLQHLRHLTMP